MTVPDFTGTYLESDLVAEATAAPAPATVAMYDLHSQARPAARDAAWGDKRMKYWRGHRPTSRRTIEQGLSDAPRNLMKAGRKLHGRTSGFQGSGFTRKNLETRHSILFYCPG